MKNTIFFMITIFSCFSMFGMNQAQAAEEQTTSLFNLCCRVVDSNDMDVKSLAPWIRPLVDIGIQEEREKREKIIKRVDAPLIHQGCGISRRRHDRWCVYEAFEFFEDDVNAYYRSIERHVEEGMPVFWNDKINPAGTLRTIVRDLRLYVIDRRTGRTVFGAIRLEDVRYVSWMDDERLFVAWFDRWPNERPGTDWATFRVSCKSILQTLSWSQLSRIDRRAVTAWKQGEAFTIDEEDYDLFKQLPKELKHESLFKLNDRLKNVERAQLAKKVLSCAAVMLFYLAT